MQPARHQCAAGGLSLDSKTHQIASFFQLICILKKQKLRNKIAERLQRSKSEFVTYRRHIK